jgi:hypothetical protein
MKRIAKLAIVMTICNVVSTYGQTQTEIEAKFGQPVNSYAVSERIWMSPVYAPDGQVCRMTFYPRKFSSTTTYLVNELPFNDFRSVIDIIIPVTIRGPQKEPFANGFWHAAGGGSWVNFVYERVTIRYSATFNINAAVGLGEPVLLDREDSEQQEKPKPLKEDFSLYRNFTAEIVTVQWNDRKC